MGSAPRARSTDRRTQVGIQILLASLGGDTFDCRRSGFRRRYGGPPDCFRRPHGARTLASANRFCRLVLADDIRGRGKTIRGYTFGKRSFCICFAGEGSDEAGRTRPPRRRRKHEIRIIYDKRPEAVVTTIRRFHEMIESRNEGTRNFFQCLPGPLGSLATL